jgi:ABC-type transport system involved in cytochrome bd biosynthesis fused ATPase/permease subunit
MSPAEVLVDRERQPQAVLAARLPITNSPSWQFDTQLGTWFRDGKELSGGQWQKIALSRAFMRSRAEVLILDEPTAAIDAKAEAEIFAHFRELTGNRISIIISHRFSTVRIADHILVMDQGKIQYYHYSKVMILTYYTGLTLIHGLKRDRNLMSLTLNQYRPRPLIQRTEMRNALLK